MAEHTADLVNLTIDGRPVSVPKGTVIWAAARKLSTEIPIYCYHPKMDPLGACRMCFVEVERMPKLGTACQRCVRFCQEVAMENGLVMKERGFRTEVGVEEEAPFDSIFSGNVVEMCPVGALTANSYRFTARPWELRHTASVCGNCSVG